MNQEDQCRCLNETIRIGDELLSSAKFEADRASWTTMLFDEHANIIWRELVTIYNGVCGIVLFLLELYKRTEAEKYLCAAIAGIRWVDHYCRHHPDDNYAFYTGRMGVSYTMIKVFEITKDTAYLEMALHNARRCNRFLDLSHSDDLLNGVSGMLLGLLHLYALTHEQWVLQRISSAAEHLANTAYHGKVGVYWDHSPNCIRGLCGLSHGASGIGFVFLELGNYFGDATLYWLAEQAFLYEASCYDESIRNWPDFRKGIHNPEDYEEHIKAYLQNNLAFFTMHGDMNAWCHGAAGIGLVRLRALELLGKPVYEREAQLAITKTFTTTVECQSLRRWQTFTLCHGDGGNAELLLEAYRHFGHASHLVGAEAIAVRALNSKEAGQAYSPGYTGAGTREDKSLFMGNAGIGYFYLRMLDPLNVPSVLAPRLSPYSMHFREPANEEGITILKCNPRTIVIQSLFRRTLYVMKCLAPNATQGYLENDSTQPRASEKLQFIHFVEKTMVTLSPEIQERLCDVYELELEKVRMNDAIASNALLHIEELVRCDRLRSLNADEKALLMKQEYKLNRAAVIKSTKWRWDLASPDQWAENLTSAPSAYQVLLTQASTGITEDQLSQFSYMVLNAFQNVCVAGELIERVIAAFEPILDSEKERLKNIVTEQVWKAITSGVIVTDNSGSDGFNGLTVPPELTRPV
ncbi:MAG: hypothetical protein M1132_13640 [Chloroflexi bacterium]|nr:hypothetical protein [Chloroflexota bacterium]